MKMILFGAGASYGAGNIIPEKPPLGTQLYSELKRYYPYSWGSFPDSIDKLFESNFEVGMEAIWERYSASVSELMQHMALYFVQFKPTHPRTTLYYDLAKEIERNHKSNSICLSSLNYECILEREANSAGLTIDYFNFPPGPSAVTVYKLHGSCNFIMQGIRAPRRIRFGREVLFDDAISPINDLNNVISYCLANNAFPPVMCLFMKGKPTQVSPQSVSLIQTKWRYLVSASEEIALIGVRPNMADTHIWRVIAESACVPFYIGDEAAYKEWHSVYKSKIDFNFISNNFQDGINYLTSEFLR